MSKGVMKLYIAERWLYEHKLPFYRTIKLLIRVFCGATIPYKCKIGKDTSFPHGAQGVVLHEDAIIGDHCIIQCNAVIGGKSGREGAPRIGNDCLIGAGAAVLGKITIGNNVAVGANAVVLEDVPDNAVVVGIPGRIIKYSENKKL